MKVELSKIYNFQEVESHWYDFWESRGYFRADAASGKPAFVIVMPPPNVTGSLHMGHMLNNTVHDVIVRRKRMQGFNTLWLPGTDHAGIATQNVVERQLREEGLSRHDLGREKFVERVWEWKREYGDLITKQIRRIGASCDWSRERFTLDEGLSRAVREVFVRLYEEGLIYRGKRLINWCPRCHTALSDLEVQHDAVEGKLYQIRYPIKDSDGEFIEVATTRPETMLGDTGVAVHPEDERYAHLKGKSATLPLIGRDLPFIQDEFVEREFGTGVVKVTPAHDPNDFDMGNRHGLEQVSVIDGEGIITPEGGAYAGLDRFEARKRVLEDLEAQGPPREGGRPHPQRGSLFPVQDNRRTVAVDPVVRPDRAARPRGDPGGRGGRHTVRPVQLGENLLRMDVQHPRLVHIPPALVGSSHPGLVLRGLRRSHGCAHGSDHLPELWIWQTEAGRGCSRYVVQFGPLALLNNGMA